MNRRHFGALALALGACGGKAEAGPDSIAPLKDAAPFPLGVCAKTDQTHDAGWTTLAITHFDRITPEWEMKAEAFFAGGSTTPDYDLADRLVAWAERSGMAVFGHVPVWYSQVPPQFETLHGDRDAFRAAYAAYVTDVIGRWRGRLTGWDVVNEPVTDEGSELRVSTWSRNLGDDGYIVEALNLARAADPAVPLLINEYHLESKPTKFATYQRLIERLLRAGAPLTAIGTQTHITCALPTGAITRTVRELSRFGLPVHVSEMDVSTTEGDPRRLPALYAEAADALAALPEAQRFGLTVWGLRDSDSYLASQASWKPLRRDEPMLFNADGRPKAAAVALRQALSRI